MPPLPLAAAIAAAIVAALAVVLVAAVAWRRGRKNNGGPSKRGNERHNMPPSPWPWWAAVPVALALALGAVVLGVAFLRTRAPPPPPFPPAPSPPQQGGASPPTGQCTAADAHTCGAEDDVSDPAYNMKEIAKQSILLEEHLVEKNKRCKDCIVKHFLHIIALSEEAQMLAGANIAKYPLMADSAACYNGLLQQWLRARESDLVQRRIEEHLRARRKQLVERYVLMNPA